MDLRILFLMKKSNIYIILKLFIKIENPLDELKENLKLISDNKAENLNKEAIETMKKRKMISNEVVKFYIVKKGEKFSVK